MKIGRTNVLFIAALAATLLLTSRPALAHPNLQPPLQDWRNPVASSNACGPLNFARTDYRLNQSPYAVATSDFNGDGKADLVSTIWPGDTVAVMLGNGDGTFQPALYYSAGLYPQYLVVADLNHDGKLDLAVADNTSPGYVAILLGNGDGSFQLPIQFAAGGDFTEAIAIGDFNRDGKPDLVVSNQSGPGLSTLLGNGDGSFQPATAYRSVGGGGTIAVGDLNHDGNPDFVLSWPYAHAIDVAIGDGHGGFSINYIILGDNAGAAFIALGDFNEDGNLDIGATSGSYNQAAGVLLGNGDGSFQPEMLYNISGASSGLAIADLNGDGHSDIAVSDSNNNVVNALLGDGNASFQREGPFAVGLNPNSLASADFNKDGKLDLVTVEQNYNTDTLSVLLNTCATVTTTPLPTHTPTRTATQASTSSPMATITPSRTPTAVNTQMPTATPTQCGAGYRILLAYADGTGVPTNLQAAMLAQPGVSAVDLFDASVGTPTLAQMQQHDEVFTFSNSPYQDPTTLGNNLADYQDGGGVVVASYASFFGHGNFYIQGRWHTGGYSPYDYSTNWAYGTVGLGVYSATHPLMQGVVTMTASYRYNPPLAAGATQVATYTDGSPAIGFKTTSGHAAVGMLAYLGNGSGSGTGDYARVAVNALRWLKPSACGSGTPTAVPPTATRTVTPLPATSTPQPPTNTPGGPTNTPVLPTVTPTDCANPFIDISGNTFYYAIHYLFCRGVVNGTDATHYSPAGTSTRAQFAKVVVLGFGLPLSTPQRSTFSDVPPSYWAYLYIESGYQQGILSGFDATTCAAHGVGYPCYLPDLAITRGQLTKLVVSAAHYPLYTPTGGQTFSDVPPSNVFFASIETAAHKGVVNGYPDGTFRPNNNIRRDEMAQIVYKGITTP